MNLSWQQMMLFKFPNFDKDWIVATQIVWFKDFVKLLRASQEKS